MKHVLLFLIMIYPMMARPSGFIVESEIKGFELRSCRSDGKQCVTIRSPLAQGTMLRPIYSMREINVQIERIQGKQQTISRRWENVSGFYDAEMRHVVIWQKSPVREFVIDLVEAKYTETTLK